MPASCSSAKGQGPKRTGRAAVRRRRRGSSHQDPRATGLAREEVYIANIVKCRLPGNRDPAPEEVAACRGFLERQIALIRPRLVVALGRVAAQSLLGSGEPLGRLRGSWHDLGGIPLRVTYHPAALLRNAGYKRPTWEDMQLIRDRLHELS
ncbi:MAG: uracil-DNA glycosylase [Thermoanaerobaculia bacterium]